MDFWGTLKKIAEATVIIAAFLFLAGWAYLYGYFTAFGLRTGDLSFPIQTVLMYTVPVLEGKGAIVVAALVFLFIVLNLIAWKLPAVPRWFAKPIAPTLIVVATGLAFGLWLSHFGAAIGRDRAHRDIVLETSVLPYVQVSAASELDVAIQACDLTSWYKLLLHANGSYYVFKPLDVSLSSGRTKHVRVCIIPESQVRAVRIQVPVSSQ
ncbi:MAG TPA: hypothetical protein VE994_01100 [Terriglobales bacterium]|nr:hypothetical protein [Terriglobales bacterium]